MSRLSNRYAPDEMFVGCHHLRELAYRPRPARNARQITVLMPLEAVHDPKQVRKYIDEFVHRGWRVLIKTRPAFPESARALYVNTTSSAVEFVDDISEEQIVAGVDAIAGAQSTYLYEMAGLGRPIWYLKTSFTLIDTIVADGIAHEVTLSALRNDNLAWLFHPKCTEATFKSLFSTTVQTDVVRRVLQAYGVALTGHDAPDPTAAAIDS